MSNETREARPRAPHRQPVLRRRTVRRRKARLIGERGCRQGRDASPTSSAQSWRLRRRPALGQRAFEYVTEAGRISAKLLPRFDTITYGQLWERVQAFSAALENEPLKPGDRIAILGFTSVDYTVVDIATTQLGVVSVPLQTSAPLAQLQPIVAETEPTVIASSIDYVDDAVELILSGGQERSDSGNVAGPAPKRLVVFDVKPEDDDQRDALEAAKARLQAPP